MKYIRKLVKSLILPVSCLPICVVMMAVGYALCPSSLNGGNITGTVQIIGFFLIKAGGSLIFHIPWLLAIGVAVGMADDHDGTAGLASLVSWLMIINLLSPEVIATLTGVSVNAVDPTFSKIENPIIGILSGLIGSGCYNRFKESRLPEALSFFSGKRCVAIVTAIVSVIASIVLYFVWPVLYTGLSVAETGVFRFVFYIVFFCTVAVLVWKAPKDKSDETRIEPSGNDFFDMAAVILEGLGGKENIVSVDNCITRLRLEIEDYTAVDEKKIKTAGVSGLIRPNKTSIQVIIGPEVQFVTDEFKNLL